MIYIANKATYKLEELTALKQELETPVHRSIVATNESEIEFSKDRAVGANESEIELSESFGAIVPHIAEFVEAFISQNLWRKLIWNLNEAATASGYSRFHLRSAIAQGHLLAKKVGRGWKIRPQDLQCYTNWLFEEIENGETPPMERLFNSSGQHQKTTKGGGRVAGLQN